MLESNLYSLIIRAILNEEMTASRNEQIPFKGNSKKAKMANQKKEDGLELAEKIRQIIGGIGREEHLAIVEQNQNWISYCLNISIENAENDVAGFILQITSGVHREEHFLSANDRPMEIFLPNGRRSLLRLFPLHQNSQFAANHSVGNSHFYRRNGGGSPPPPSKHSSSSLPHPHLLPSSTSSSSSPSVASNEGGIGIGHHGPHFSLNSLATKSSSLLRRWTHRSQHHSPHRQLSPLLTLRVRDLANRQHELPILIPSAAGPTSSTHFNLKFTLKKMLASEGNGGIEFQPIELSEFVACLRIFKQIFLRRWTNFEGKETMKGGLEEENEGEKGIGQRQNDLANAFRHFNQMRETSESLKQTLDEATNRLAHFNDFSELAQSLLTIGVNLEECKFGHFEGDEHGEKRRELAKATIGQQWKTIKDGAAQIDENEQQELKAAIFLAERLADAFTEAGRQAKCHRLFVPPSFAHSAQIPFARSLANHFGQFDRFAAQISPLLDLLQSPIWSHPAVSGLCPSISRIFDHSLQQQLAEFIRSQFDRLKGDLDGFGDLIDSIRLFLSHSGVQSIERLFERVWLPFPNKLIHALDDPLCRRCQSLLKSSIAALNPRDSDQTVEFTKLSMRLFDAFRELAELANKFGQNYSFQQFEHWFEPAAIYWTGTWRTIYIGFIRKSIEESSIARTSSSPPPLKSSHSRLSLRRRSSVLPDPFCSTPSPPRGSRQFILADFQLNKNDIQMHEATFNCLAFCKALCDDFLRLSVRHEGILLLAILQIASILADCLSTFCSLLLQQVKVRPTFSQMLRAANGIEHASLYLLQNVERFLELKNCAELAKMEEAEMEQTLASCRRILGAARARSRAVADQIVESLCERKMVGMRHYCALITRNWEDLSSDRKPLRCYLRQMFSPINERADQLLMFLDKACGQLHSSLLPRLHSIARLALWQNVHRILEQQLLRGQPPEYYEQIEKACHSICQILQLEWGEQQNALHRLLHSNKASTKELILQYYANLADSTGASNCGGSRIYAPKTPQPRICIRLGYVRTTSQQCLLQIHVLSAFDIPVLDSLTHSSDPYVRIELLPRFLFPLNLFPAQNTETIKQTLNPRWNQLFQIALPDELFFMNGACLCLTVLDHDVMSYNDLAGQTFLRLATIPRLNDPSTRKLSSSSPLILPLRMPDKAQYASETFQILEQRSARKDELAKEMSGYEKYIRDYCILPPCAQDDKEWTSRLRCGIKRGKERMQRMVTG